MKQSVLKTFSVALLSAFLVLVFSGNISRAWEVTSNLINWFMAVPADWSKWFNPNNLVWLNNSGKIPDTVLPAMASNWGGWRNSFFYSCGGCPSWSTIIRKWPIWLLNGNLPFISRPDEKIQLWNKHIINSRFYDGSSNYCRNMKILLTDDYYPSDCNVENVLRETLKITHAPFGSDWPKLLPWETIRANIWTSPRTIYWHASSNGYVWNIDYNHYGFIYYGVPTNENLQYSGPVKCKFEYEASGKDSNWYLCK